MSTWHSVSLGDGMWAPALIAQIEARFGPLFDQAGRPADMAVFTRSENEGRLHCEVIAYFPPAASQVAAAFEAQPCERPQREGLGLLAGAPEAWATLFTERA